MRLAALGALLTLVAALAAVVLTARASGQSETPLPAGTIEEQVPPPAETPATQPIAATLGWGDRARGISLTYPEGWRVRRGNGTTCLTLEGVRATVRVVERFRWSRAPGAGAAVHAERGRSIAVRVSLAPGAAPATVGAAKRVSGSIALARSGRCLPPAAARIRWRASRPLGLPYAGWLRGGVRLPTEGRHFFTWDPVLRRSPDRPGRRWGTAGVVRTTLAIVNAYAAAHPEAPRVGIGDLSRRGGGPFGPKHVSHQNGLDVDVYYPRRDGAERPPRTVAQVDRRLAQDLVDRFVAAGATKVFVGPNVGLAGPPGVVQRLPNHDNHLHARFPPSRAR